VSGVPEPCLNPPPHRGRGHVLVIHCDVVTVSFDDRARGQETGRGLVESARRLSDQLRWAAFRWGNLFTGERRNPTCSRSRAGGGRLEKRGHKMRVVRLLSAVAVSVVLLGVLASGAEAAVTVSRAELNGTRLRIDGSGALPNHSVSINPGAVTATSDNNGAFRVDISPYSSATCQVTVSDGATSASVTLSGCTPATPPPPPPGPAPIASLSPTTLTFGAQATGTTSPAQTVTATNTGNAALTISSAGPGGANAADFVKATDSCSGVTLAAG